MLHVRTHTRTHTHTHTRAHTHTHTRARTHTHTHMVTLAQKVTNNTYPNPSVQMTVYTSTVCVYNCEIKWIFVPIELNGGISLYHNIIRETWNTKYTIP